MPTTPSIWVKLLQFGSVSNLSLLALIVILIAMAFQTARVSQIKEILPQLDKLPEKDRLVLLLQTLGKIGRPSKVSSKDWIKAEGRRQRHVVIVAIVIALFLFSSMIAPLVIEKIWRVKTPTELQEEFAAQVSFVDKTCKDANALRENGETDPAEAKFKDAREHARKAINPDGSGHPYDLGMAKAIDGLAMCAEDRGQSLAALELLRKGASYLEKPLLLGRNLLAQGNTLVSLAKGDHTRWAEADQAFGEAESQLDKSLTDAKDEQDRRDLVVDIQIGRERMEIEKAPSVSTAKVITKRISDDLSHGIKHGIPERYQNLGVNCFKLQLYPQAKENAQKAAKINEVTGGNKTNLVTNYQLMAAADLVLHPDDCKTECIEALRICFHSKQEVLALSALQVWAFLLVNNGQLLEASRVIAVIELEIERNKSIAGRCRGIQLDGPIAVIESKLGKGAMTRAKQEQSKVTWERLVGGIVKEQPLAP